MIGYAFCGSFCTFSDSLKAMEELIKDGEQVLPIMSERAYATDTRFFKAEDFKNRVRELTGREIIHTVEDAEPLGARMPLDALVVAPCTGNTLAKVAQGITDGTVTMAIKAHLRCDRPTLLCLASNDAMSQNLSNLGRLATRRAVYFVPMRQDDPTGKPYSLVADMKKSPEALVAALAGRQIRPLFI